MAGPIANVQQVITITGVDNASDAIAKAKGSLKGLESQAVATGVATTSGLDAGKVQQTTQRMGGAFSALAGAMGPTAAGIAEIGKSATALGSTAAILPGPLGLAAAAVVGLAFGAKMLLDNMSQAAAKVRLLYSPDTRKLGDDLKFSADQTQVLHQAFTSLGPNAIAPNVAILKQVVDNANEMGADPAEAVKKFIDAWKTGPQAVAAVQADIGKLNVTLQTSSEVWRSVGFNPSDLGLDETVDVLKNANDSSLKLTKSRANAEEIEKRIKSLNENLSPRTLEQLRNEQSNLDVQNMVTRELETHMRQYGTQIKAQQELKDIETKRGSWSQANDMRAQLAGNKEEQRSAKQANIDTERRFIALQIQTIEAARLAIGDKEADAKLRALGTDKLALDLKQKAIADERKADAQAAAQAAKATRDATNAAADERKADAKAAAQAAEATRDATNAAKLAKQKADIDRDGVQTIAERLRLLQSERDIDVAKASRIKNAGQRTAELDKIAAQTATNVAAINRDGADAEVKAAKELADKIDELASTKAQSEIDKARNSGDERKAINLEKAESERKYTAAVLALTDARIAASAKEGVTETSKRDTLAALNQQAINNAANHQVELAGLTQKGDDESDKQLKKSIADFGNAATIVGKTSELIGRKTGKIVGSIGKGISDITKNWKSFGESGADAISATGSIVSSFVEGEKERAAILAIMETAAAIVAFTNPATYVAGAGHAAAAVLYAGVAGGVIGGSSAGGASGETGGFAQASQVGSVGSSNSGTGGKTVIVNFNQPLATKQEIGKAIAGAMNSLTGTGIQSLKGV